MAVELTPDQAMQLLDFNQKFDIALLDNVINQFYGGYGQQVCMFIICRISLSTRYFHAEARACLINLTQSG